MEHQALLNQLQALRNLVTGLGKSMDDSAVSPPSSCHCSGLVALKQLPRSSDIRCRQSMLLSVLSKLKDHVLQLPFMLRDNHQFADHHFVNCYAYSFSILIMSVVTVTCKIVLRELIFIHCVLVQRSV